MCRSIALAVGAVDAICAREPPWLCRYYAKLPRDTRLPNVTNFSDTDLSVIDGSNDEDCGIALAVLIAAGAHRRCSISTDDERSRGSSSRVTFAEFVA